MPKSNDEIIVHPYRAVAEVPPQSKPTGPKSGLISVRPVSRHVCEKPRDSNTLTEGMFYLQRWRISRLKEGYLWRCDVCYEVWKLVLRYPIEPKDRWVWLRWDRSSLEEWKEKGGTE